MLTLRIRVCMNDIMSLEFYIVKIRVLIYIVVIILYFYKNLEELIL